MDWTPIREAVRQACAAATGLDIRDVQLETERGAFNASRGRRLRLDWEQRDTSEPATEYQEQLDGTLVEYVRTEREITINARFFCDDHRTAIDSGGWAHELADRLASRLWLSDVAALYKAVGLVLATTDTILPDPQVDVDGRQQSVATLRMTFNYLACEFATDPPGDPNAIVDYFDRVEIDERRPRAVYQRDLLALGPWRSLWLGEETDVAGGRIVQVSGDAQLRVGDPRTWSLGTGTVALEDLDEYQLLDGQALALVFTAAQPGATISVLGRVAGGLGWALEGLSDGSLRLAALGTGGEVQGALPGRLDGSERVAVVHNSVGVLSLYEDGDVVSAAISGSHLAGPAALVAGALRFATSGVVVRLLGQVTTVDPNGFRVALVAALGI